MKFIMFFQNCIKKNKKNSSASMIIQIASECASSCRIGMYGHPGSPGEQYGAMQHFSFEKFKFFFIFYTFFLNFFQKMQLFISLRPTVI